MNDGQVDHDQSLLGHGLHLSALSPSALVFCSSTHRYELELAVTGVTAGAGLGT